MDFFILNHTEAKRGVSKYPHKLNVISIEKTEFVDPKLCKNHLLLPIDDISDLDIDKSDGVLKQAGMVYPEKEHIIKAIEFDKQCNHHLDIIHCHAGISRSPAIAYAVLRGRGYSIVDAIKILFELQPFACPNERIIRLTDELIK